MLADTLAKFNASELLVKDYNYWSLILREQQVTFGAMILICKEEETSFGDLSVQAFSELKTITNEVETYFRLGQGALKMNYLMLMMVDPEVHFHIFPRYDTNIVFEGSLFEDTSWPKAPELTLENTVTSELLLSLKQKFSEEFKD